METPETRYARSGDVSIAYQVLGEGSFDLVYVPGAFSHVDLIWTDERRAQFFRALASFARVIVFDKRGTGASDRAEVADLESRMDDVRAVMDDAGCARAAVVGASEGGPMSMLFAATYPERTRALVLYGTFARGVWAPDYPGGRHGQNRSGRSRKTCGPGVLPSRRGGTAIPKTWRVPNFFGRRPHASE